MAKKNFTIRSATILRVAFVQVVLAISLILTLEDVKKFHLKTVKMAFISKKAFFDTILMENAWGWKQAQHSMPVLYYSKRLPQSDCDKVSWAYQTARG